LIHHPSISVFILLSPSHSSSFFLAMLRPPLSSAFFFFNAPPTTQIYTLSLHDALPISRVLDHACAAVTSHLPRCSPYQSPESDRSEEHTSELQSRENLVCRLLLEKKKKKKKNKQKNKKYNN